MSKSKTSFWFEIEKTDLNGDGRFETIYLTGNRDKVTSVYIKEICLVIEVNGKPRRIELPIKEGYNPRIFCGCFDKGKYPNLLISVDSDCVHGCSHYYLYSYLDNVLRSLFSKDFYNQHYKYDVRFRDKRCVGVHNQYLNKNYKIVLKDDRRYTEIHLYDKKGKLLKPCDGSMHCCYKVHPLDTGQKGRYNLLGVHRVLGVNDEDTLGHLQTALEWDGTKFVPVKENLLT